MRRSFPLIALFAATAVIAAACGGGGHGGTPTPTTSGTVTPSGTLPPSSSWLPLTQSDTWSYQVTKPGYPTVTKTVVVGPIEDEGGAKAGTQGTRLDTTMSSGASQKEWYRDFGSEVVRDRAVQYGPGDVEQTDSVYIADKIYVDQTAAHTAPGATWTETYTDKTYDASSGSTTSLEHTITWTVVSTADSIAVGSTSLPCLELHRVSSLTATGGADKTYWFAKGVGKVKEVDNDHANPTGTPTQVEQLTSYTVAP